MAGFGDHPAGEGHGARDYGRAAEPLPDLHVFSRLSELDEAYARELAEARARQETIGREAAELAKRLAAPLESAPSLQSETRGRRWFGRGRDGAPQDARRA
jgi:hypothetical protein